MGNNKKYLNSLSEAFAGNFSQDQLMEFMNETLTFFKSMKAGMESKDPVERAKAIQETMEMQKMLESQVEAICQKTGLSISDLAAFASDAQNMSSEELSKMEELKTQFQKVQDDEEIHTKAPFLNKKIVG